MWPCVHRRCGHRAHHLARGAADGAAHRDAVAAEADELQVDRSPVVEAGEALEHQQRRAGRHIEDRGGVAVGGDCLQGHLGVAERRAREPLEEDEDVVAGQVLLEQALPEVADDVREVERQRQVVGEAPALDVDHRSPAAMSSRRATAAGAGTSPETRTSLRTAPAPCSVSARPQSSSMLCAVLRCATTGAEAGDPLDQALAAQQVERLTDGVARDPELARPARPRTGAARRRAARAGPGGAGRRPPAGPGRPDAAGGSG